MFAAFERWIYKRGILGAIAKNAVGQFNKWQQKDKTLSEKEIAKNIFLLRYTNPNGVFDQYQRSKIKKYIDRDFYPENLVEFSLTSLDIEGQLGPMDKDHAKLVGYLEGYLGELGYAAEPPHFLDDVMRKLNPYSTKANQFNVKWFEKIKGFGAGRK